jgi:ABC-type multidrug transport system ATPase subunit
VLDGLDLEIPAGSSLAVVGANGAGKTTAIKLLARLYEPEAGRILVDGIALTDLDPAAWRRQVAVIFQDFARFELPAAENVGFGALPLLADASALTRAAERAGARALIEGLPLGWHTPLSRQHPGGVDLSGGEWQRVALARALLAVESGARVLVLDEPTANLDVRAEAELFERFLDLTAGCVPERNTGCVPERNTGCVPERNTGCVPERNTGCVPERNTGCVPERNAGCVPERNAGCVPERNAGCVPERNAGCVPERNAGCVPEHSFGCTTILVSHRFSTVRRAQRICVLDGGRVVELGSHDELMARDGRYATMYRLQWLHAYAAEPPTAGPARDGPAPAVPARLRSGITLDG